MADANTALIALASAQGATTLVLAGATLFYAVRTHDISKATRLQAQASSEMARTMRDEHLASEQPYITIESSPTPLLLENERLWEGSGGEDWQKDTAKDLVYELVNVGRGPAKDIETTVIHSAIPYKACRKATLRPGEAWKVAAEPSGELYLLLAFGGRFRGFNELMRSLEVSEFREEPSDCGIIVTYRDIHNLQWLTYLTLHIDPVRPLNSLRMMRPGIQSVVNMPEGLAHDP